MSLNLSTASLRALVSLTEKREKLLEEVSTIEAQITAALNGTSSSSAKPSGRRGGLVGNTRSAKSAKKGGKRGKRGALKELILAGLREAGEAGIAVKHLAAKLAIKPQNLHVWLHTTGKKSGLIEAAGKGVYRLKQAVGVESPNSIVEVPKPKVTRKTRKVTGTGKRRQKAKS